ncbi:MAG: signal recognition particle-docking protein FtsY [Dehalococcoidia bacterium]
MRFWRRAPSAGEEPGLPADEGRETEQESATSQDEEIEEQTGKALARTKRGLFGRLGSLFERPDFGDELWEELEEILLGADAGLPATEQILAALHERVHDDRVRKSDDVHEVLREELVRILELPGADTPAWEQPPAGEPLVILVVGVNGAGKTTSIAKLAAGFRRDGAQVILAAADTFRAAATEQLQVWGERSQVRVIAHQPGADPGAVVFDALESAASSGGDIVLIDTAGRLHTKTNLMEELKKIRRVIGRKFAAAPQETLLVLDATTGQNGISQARTFTEAVGVTGIVLAKLDGTAKGGIAFSIAHDLGIPVRFIGTGEQLDDLAVFDPHAFVDALLLD